MSGEQEAQAGRMWRVNTVNNKVSAGGAHRRPWSVKHGTERITASSGKNYLELVTATGCRQRIVDARIRMAAFRRC